MTLDMQSQIEQIFANNLDWAASCTAQNPMFFEELVAQQSPDFLWIGCSDSRVPANQIVGLAPGELFVHRNIANVVNNSDLNCLSVLQYAVEYLQVKHIIVCGHYGCGGVRAAMEDIEHGLMDNWIRNIKDIYLDFHEEFEGLLSEKERINRLCELNVRQQVNNVCHTTIVQRAWRKGQNLAVHGFIYDLHDGKLRNLEASISRPAQIHPIYRMSGRHHLV